MLNPRQILAFALLGFGGAISRGQRAIGTLGIIESGWLETQNRMIPVPDVGFMQANFADCDRSVPAALVA
jgi:hypothetical protein